MTSAALAHVLARLARLPHAPWLHEEVARRMAERLAVVKLTPEVVLDWGGFLGASAPVLHTAYPRARRLVLEPTAELAARSAPPRRPWWRVGGPGPDELADPATLPPGSGELLWANMALHAHAERPAVLAQWHAALRVGGFVMFSTLGPDTARELVALYRQQGWGPPQWPLPDMHDLGDELVQAGFADPVMDQERLTLHWSSPQALLAELRQWGGNLHPGRHPGLRTPRWRERLHQALAAGADAQGRVALTLELVYGHAFKAAPRVAAGGVATVSLDSLRRTRPAKGGP